MPKSKNTEKTLIIRDNGVKESPKVHKCKLLAVSGPLQGEEFLIDKDTFTIGSGERNDLVIEDSTISRRHCEIRLDPDGNRIIDLGSTNGTYTGGIRVSEAFLSPGSEFKLGKTRIVFCPMQESIEYRLSSNERFGKLLGASVPMRRVSHLAETYAPTEATVLIEGETGTGKEVLAEEIHKHSKRRHQPFIVIDCASLSRELVESELFGHSKGAFTGATADRAGAFEFASGGTVFLDEIGELSMDLQPKLLRVLEKREIRRVGSNQVRNIDVRIISATNRRLQNEVNAGRFREDLYYRLSVVHIEIPPLRDRKQDLPLLTRKFMQEFMGPNAEEKIADFEHTMRVFSAHGWPGNVRELRNLVEVASYADRHPVDMGALLAIGHKLPGVHEMPSVGTERPFKEVKNELIANFEKQYIKSILERHNGVVSRAAEAAGIERAYLQRLIKKYKMK